MKDSLKLPLILSAIAHGLLVLVFTVKAVLFPEQMEIFEPALRVDIVDLPDKVEAVLPPVSSPAEDNKVPIEKPTMVMERPKRNSEAVEPEVALSKKKDLPKVEENKPSPSEAIKKLKKQLAIEKIKEELKAQERQELSQRVSKYKGNVLSPGTELTGVSKLQHENYLTHLDRHVKQYWSLPEWLARGSYSAQVRIFLDEQGLLIKALLIKSSGNPSYDEIVVETVKKAVPFPMPPEKFRAMVRINGMVLGFPE